MSFWLFVVCMFSILSAADLARFVTDNRFSELPLNGYVRMAFYVVTFPAAIGVIALPIFGLFVLPWWQVIGGFVLGSVGTAVLTRATVRNWLYLWAMAFSLGAVIVFAIAIVRS